MYSPRGDGYRHTICDAKRNGIRAGEQARCLAIDTPRSVIDVLGLAGGLTDLADRHVTIERHTSHRQISYYVSNRPGDLQDQTVLVNPGDKFWYRRQASSTCWAMSAGPVVIR